MPWPPRSGRGGRPAASGCVGRKIGFTNTTIWPLYGVSAPMWNFIYDSTVHDLEAVAGGFDLRGLAEPRIEPEIVLGLAAAPEAGMSEEALLGCVGWVAHGFEIVQSVYPGWKLSGAGVGGGLRAARGADDRAAARDRQRPAGVGRAAAELHADAAQAGRGGGRGRRGERARRADPGAAVSRRGDRAVSGQCADRGGRDRDHRHADRRAAGRPRGTSGRRSCGGYRSPGSASPSRHAKPLCGAAGGASRSARARRCWRASCSPRSTRFSSARCLPRLCTASARPAAMAGTSAARCRSAARMRWSTQAWRRACCAGGSGDAGGEVARRAVVREGGDLGRERGGRG